MFSKYCPDGRSLSFSDFGSLLAQCGIEAFRSGGAHSLDDNSAEENINALLVYMEITDNHSYEEPIAPQSSMDGPGNELADTSFPDAMQAT